DRPGAAAARADGLPGADRAWCAGVLAPDGLHPLPRAARAEAEGGAFGVGVGDVTRHRRVVLAAVVFLAAWGMTYFWIYPRHFLGDVPLFETYGQAVRHGQV